MIEYADFVQSRTKPGERIKEEITSIEAHLVHMVMGISGEAGELLDAVKKATVYRKPLDVNNVVEELGDLEFYMEGLRSALGIQREEVIRANMIKLGVRYSDTYSDVAAQERADKQE